MNYEGKPNRNAGWLSNPSTTPDLIHTLPAAHSLCVINVVTPDVSLCVFFFFFPGPAHETQAAKRGVPGAALRQGESTAAVTRKPREELL